MRFRSSTSRPWSMGATRKASPGGVGEVCETVGFFYVKNHGVSRI